MSNIDTINLLFPKNGAKNVWTVENKQNGGSVTIVAGAAKPSVQDKTFQLTRRLVSAVSQFAVQQVQADAYKELTSLLMIAATSKGKEAEAARAVVKKLQKLIGRASRKMKELGEEENLAANKRRAEKRKQERLAEEIKAELKRARIKRRIRERGYLRDCGNEETAANDPAVDAQLSMQAMVIAAAEVYSGAGGSSGADGGGAADLPAADGASGEGAVSIDVEV